MSPTTHTTEPAFRSDDAPAPSPSPTAVPTTPGIRTGWHLRPFKGSNRFILVRRFLPSLWAQVENWAKTAMPRDRHPADDSEQTYDIETLSLVLKNADHWDGFDICRLLHTQGWQCDYALVKIVQEWSYACRRALIEDAHRDKKGEAGA